MSMEYGNYCCVKKKKKYPEEPVTRPGESGNTPEPESMNSLERGLRTIQGIES